MTEQKLQKIKDRFNSIISSEYPELLECIELGVPARQTVPALIAEVERLRRALEFYAKETHYRPITLACGDKEIFIERDCGGRARKVLEGKN